VTQSNQAFSIFTAGQDKASLLRTVELSPSGASADYFQTIDFKGGPAQVGHIQSWPVTVYGEVLPGVTPGTASYTQVVGGNYYDYFVLTRLTSAVLEPESYAMLLAGMGLIGCIVRRRNTKQR
jgi:hypothetical protein